MKDFTYARIWPRAIFDHPDQKTGRELLVLKQPGVYVLYWNDKPYYVGQATNLRIRLWHHANRLDVRYYNFWNYLSAFVLAKPRQRNEI
jgi:hypothetical protein